jgi:hypothetical protein
MKGEILLWVCTDFCIARRAVDTGGAFNGGPKSKYSFTYHHIFLTVDIYL